MSRPTVGLPLLSMEPGQVSGIVTMVRELLPRLARHPDAPHLALLVHDGAAERVADLDLTGVEVVRSPNYPTYAVGWRRVAAMVDGMARPRRRWGSLDGRVDLVHYPLCLNVPRTDAPVVMTLHDIQHHDRPELFSRKQHVWRRYSYDRAARNATLVITDSDHARRRIIEIVGIAPERIRTIHLGVDLTRFAPEPAEDDEARLAPFALPERFLLYPAGLWPHKNHERLFRALAAVDDTELGLVLTGATFNRLDEVLDQARGAGVGDRVRHLGQVEDATLPALYRRATALAFPSLYEGFGVPPLEAMASGLPVASSREASLAEVVGEAAAELDPRDVEQMAAALGTVVADESLRAELRTAGFAQVGEFGWDKAADAHLEAYARALELARD